MKLSFFMLNFTLFKQSFSGNTISYFGSPFWGISFPFILFVFCIFSHNIVDFLIIYLIELVFYLILDSNHGDCNCKSMYISRVLTLNC